jgi:hypothetical protein
MDRNLHTIFPTGGKTRSIVSIGYIVFPNHIGAEPSPGSRLQARARASPAPQMRSPANLAGHGASDLCKKITDVGFGLWLASCADDESVACAPTLVKTGRQP